MEPNITIAENVGPQPLPSLPSSPITEEDLSRSTTWATDDNSNSDDQGKISWRTDRGKSKEVVGSCDDDFVHTGETSEDDGTGGTYPPANEDDAETRRIEEVSTGIDYLFGRSNSEISLLR